MMKVNKKEMIICLSQTYRGFFVCPSGNREKFYGKFWDNVSKEIFSAICLNFDWINERTLVNIYSFKDDKLEKSCQLITKTALKETIRDGYYALPTHIYYEFGAIDSNGNNYETTIMADNVNRAEVMQIFDNWLRENNVDPDEVSIWHIMSYEKCEIDELHEEIIDFSDDDEE